MTTTDTMAVTKTIMSQIKAIDFWAFGAWGSKKYISLDETSSRLGGLQFDVSNCSKIKRGRVLVELNGLDLYKVSVFRHSRKKNEYGFFDAILKEEKVVSNVFAEDLVSIIDGIVG